MRKTLEAFPKDKPMPSWRFEGFVDNAVAYAGQIYARDELSPRWSCDHKHLSRNDAMKCAEKEFTTGQYA